MFTVRVMPDQGGETYEITAKSRDVVRWEAMDKRNNLSRLQEELRMSDLFGLAYAACRRQGVFAGSYQEFLDTHDIEPIDEDDEQQAGPGAGERETEPPENGERGADPTPAVPSDASLSS